MRSKYIVIEGLEGAGKTTARNVVVDTLKALGVADMVFTREPGGTQLAEKLRSLVLDIKSVGDEVITDKAEVLMFYAARVQLVETVIKPALARGQWVIGDRHDLSTQAYQGGGRGIDRTMLATLRDAVLGDFRPDLTLYLDVTPEVGLQRARARGGQARKDGERVDEALVEHAEDQIDDEHGDQQQDAEALQRGLEGLGRALQAGVERGRQAHFLFERLDAVDRVAKRYAGQKIERNSRRWELSLVIDGHGLGALRVPRHRVERNQLAVGCSHVDTREHRGVGLVLGRDFKNHLVLACRAVDRRDLARAVGTLQCVLDLRETESVAGNLVAINLDFDDGPLVVEIAGDVDKTRQLANFAEQHLCPVIKLLEIGALQRVLVERGCLLAANADRRRVLHVDADSGNGSKLGTQLLDDLVGRQRALVARLEDQVERAGVRRRARPAAAHRRHERADVRVLRDDRRDGALALDHGGKGGVLCAFR